MGDAALFELMFVDSEHAFVSQVSSQASQAERHLRVCFFLRHVVETLRSAEAISPFVGPGVRACN